MIVTFWTGSPFIIPHPKFRRSDPVFGKEMFSKMAER
jgi:hypothetical protein